MKYTPNFIYCNEENLKLFKSHIHYKQKLITLRIAMIATGIYTIDQTEDIIKLLTRLQLSLKIKSFKPIENNNYEVLSWTNNLKEEICLTVNDILLLKGFTITEKNFNTNDAFYSFFINEMFAEAAAYCIKYKAHIKEIIENISSTYSDIEIVDIDGECCVRLYFNHDL